ncbi:MAG: hypothetical protein IT555_13390 [Acetobacteraceae bacterium]|nr:hypothetical protein [Acetobacteraceae bacterium]
MPRQPTFRTRLASSLLLASLASGCAPFIGFPDDPAARSALKSYFGPDSEAEYRDSDPDAVRTAVRNRIVRQRLYGYDLEYSDFKRGLASQGNIVSVGGGLAVLGLSGVAATTGNLATAGALAAASAGVIGAQGLINKELYFQKTLPALVAQMDAARDRIIAKILDGLVLPDSSYPLVRANVDLARLKDAGSIESAIGTISEQANLAKIDAAREVTIDRDANFLGTMDARRQIRLRLNALGDTEVVRLANAMLPAFTDAPEAARTLAQRYAPPPGQRFTAAQAVQARRFLVFWSGSETMTPDRQATWMRAIDAL